MSKRDQFLAKGEKLANIGLTLGGLVASLIFLNFLYQYSWTQQRQFSRSADFILYYVFPGGLAVLLFAALKLNAIPKVNLVILFVTVAASLYGLELLLESAHLPLDVATKPVMALLSGSSDDRRKYAAGIKQKFGIEIDTRTSGEALEDLRKKGVDAVPVVTPSNHLFRTQPDGSIRSALNIDGQEVMPLAGVSGKVTLLCNESGQWIDYRSDEHGFSNSNDIWHSGRVEIAALGDSFTHGYCVPANKSFVALIGQQYPATLNLGVAGDGPLLMLAKVNEYLPLFKPKTVLWFYYEGNDLTDLQIERRSALLRNYMNDGFIQEKLADQSEVDGAIIDEMSRRSALEGDIEKTHNANALSSKFAELAKLSVLRQRMGLVGGMRSEDAKLGPDLAGPNMEVFRNIMVQAKMRVDAWGGQLIFVYLPEWARYAGYTSWGKTKRDEVLSFVRRLGLPVVDIDPAFQAHGDPLSLFPFRGVGHYTEDGHRLVAEEVLRSLSPRPHVQRHPQASLKIDKPGS